jgi:hypothetical protein
MDKDVLRRLGWSEDLIDVVDATSLPSVRPGVLEVGSNVLDVPDAGIGATSLDLSDAPMIASSALRPPRWTR